MKGKNRLICSICGMKFSSVSTKNRHLKNKHHENVEERKSQDVKCPICPEEKKEPFTNHDSLIGHLTETHNISLKQYNFNFRNMEEFEKWRSQNNRGVDYACVRNIKGRNGEEYVYYSCNQSNSRCFSSNCTKRAMKTGGSIKIVGGVCPSRICAKISENGIHVKFVETHVGHEEEQRARHLLKTEQQMIVEKLNLGVSQKKENEVVSFERRKEILLEDVNNFIKNLDREELKFEFLKFV